MDIVLNDGSGLDLIRQLRASLPEIVILILTMEDENIYAERVMESGANGYISKTCGGAAVLEALRRVMNGEVYLSPEFALRMVQKRFCHRKPVGLALDQLSTREFQVFQLLGRWQGTREIAGDLNLSIKTIEHYRETIKKKLGVANSTELVKLATSWSDNQRTTQSE
jgi:DNA-binding NarL/FixJ family response regulator